MPAVLLTLDELSVTIRRTYPWPRHSTSCGLLDNVIWEDEQRYVFQNIYDHNVILSDPAAKMEGCVATRADHHDHRLWGCEDESNALETNLGAAHHTNRLWNASAVGIDVGVERAA